jgi:hypothetical protein
LKAQQWSGNIQHHEYKSYQRDSLCHYIYNKSGSGQIGRFTDIETAPGLVCPECIDSRGLDPYIESLNGGLSAHVSG